MADITEYPKLSEAQLAMTPIDRLGKDLELHNAVRDKLLERLAMSERRMKQFYARWTIAERKLQAYVQLNDYEQALKEQNDASKEPKAIPLIVPYCYASQATVATYLLHTFAGRKPIFQIGSNNAEGVEPAQKMEIMIQWNADSVRLVKQLWQFINDGQCYGLSAMRTGWKEDKKLRTVWRTPQANGLLQQAQQFLGMNQERQKSREERLVFQGTGVGSIDPFLFFPDPRVPMVEVSRKGEFVFWREFVGRHYLLQEQEAGRLKWVERIQDAAAGIRTSEGADANMSARSVLSGGQSQPGMDSDAMTKSGKMFIQADQGTIMINPREWGLGNGSAIERWIFTLGNRQQIVQAQKFEADHDMHPVVVSEPFSMGYGFGQPGLHDYIGPLQDAMSWFMTSHMFNVRAALNNMFVVDPNMVEMQDLKNPKPGKIIRLKRAAYGQDVRTALTQLAVSDVTAQHVENLQIVMKMGDALVGTNDNLRGQQDFSGRKTATEVRTSGEAAASRLAAMSRVVSAQALVDLAEQMSMNFQQGLTETFYLGVVGQEGKTTPVTISPEMVVGDFHFPVHDGTLPLDRVAMLDIWKEIWMQMESSPELKMKYDTSKVFNWIAELSGARNIKNFERPGMANAMPQAMVGSDEAVAQGAQAGNLVPAQAPGLPGTAPGLRMIQGGGGMQP